MFYIIYTTDYDDPCPIVGPFDTFDGALAAYRQSVIDSGADIGDGETAEALYLADDCVRVGRLVG